MATKRVRRRKKSRNTTLIASAVIVAALVAVALYYLNSPYKKYSDAFDNTNQAGSSEYVTQIEVTVDNDETYSAEGHMYIRIDEDTDTVNFVNYMELEDNTVTQFSDGVSFYVDNGNAKRKWNLGETAEPEAELKERGDYKLEDYISQYCELLDANRLRDLQITQKMDQRLIERTTLTSTSSGYTYALKVSKQLIENVFNVVTAYAIDEDETSATVEVNNFSYEAKADRNNYMYQIIYNIDMDANIPAKLTGDEEEDHHIDIKMIVDIENPGGAVDFALPSTDGF
ncbi:MAG: hypothetical protein LBL96_02920 [Clostridiales bacterium]|nr:hypothetical protein [Clostridiales bacterium]